MAFTMARSLKNGYATKQKNSVLRGCSKSKYATTPSFLVTKLMSNLLHVKNLPIQRLQSGRILFHITDTTNYDRGIWAGLKYCTAAHLFDLLVVENLFLF